VLTYAALLALGVGGFLLVRHLGTRLIAPAPVGAEIFGAPGDAKAKVDTLMHLLLALAVIIVTARGVGAVFAYLSQPPVIGEVIAGLLLGPSVLGRIAPSASSFILPPSVAPFLGILAQVGVVLYMFLVGAELDLSRLRKLAHSTVAISHASILAPFLLGSTLALALYTRFASSDVPFTHFALFLGVAMSVTAFPVLARILTDRGIQSTPMGTVALTCAAVDDVTAWCLLAIVVSVASNTGGGALLTLGLSAVYVGVMLAFVRPLLARLANWQARRPSLGRGVLALVCVLLLVSALTTEAIGIHALFGAFALGAMMPHDSSLATDLKARLEDLVVVFLLPAFFAYTGMRTQMGLVGDAESWAWCLIIILTASLGKFGGSFLAARASGFGLRDAASLGILMNTRGLVELIVLNVGLDLRVISPRLFAMLVVMAVVTTLSTTPILQALSVVRPVPVPERA